MIGRSGRSSRRSLSSGHVELADRVVELATAGAVETIGQIGTIIAKINDLQTMIAAALEQQTATTNESNRSVSEAAAVAADIAANIATVAGAVAATTEGVRTCKQAAGDLAGTSEELRRLVARFRVAAPGPG